MTESPKFNVTTYSYRSEPYGYCLYCGSKNDLSTEHAIPFALLGRIELVAASCGECRVATHEFETHCIDQLFGATRYRMGIPRRPGRKQRETHNARVVREDGTEENLLIPTADFPRGMSIPVLHPPTLVGGLFPAHEHASSMWTRVQDGDFDALSAKYGKVAALRRTIRIPAFQRMLAKIGHCIAWSTVEREEIAQFDMLLPPVIRFGEDAHALVGSIATRMEKTADMHQTEVFTVSQHADSGSRELLLATFRLMAFMDAPQHLVVVGTRPLVPDGQ